MRCRASPYVETWRLGERSWKVRPLATMVRRECAEGSFNDPEFGPTSDDPVGTLALRGRVPLPSVDVIPSTEVVWLRPDEIQAYAKLHGSCVALWQGLADDALRDLTSWPVEKVTIAKKYSRGGAAPGRGAPLKLKDPSELWGRLTGELSAGTVIMCSRVVGDDGLAPDAGPSLVSSVLMRRAVRLR